MSRDDQDTSAMWEESWEQGFEQIARSRRLNKWVKITNMFAMLKKLSQIKTLYRKSKGSNVMETKLS